MSSNTPFLQNLDTTFVNLWSLLRKLTEQQFVGRVHIELKDYSADIFLNGSPTPLVREVDRTANTETLEEGALHRVVLRTRETPGTINVFAGADEATLEQPAPLSPEPLEPVEMAAERSELVATRVEPAQTVDIREPQPATRIEPEFRVEPAKHTNREPPPAPQMPASPAGEIYPSGSYDDWPAVLAATGELVAAIERGVNAAGGDFLRLFNAVRLELADDYIFLDPMPQTLQYAQGIISLNQHPPLDVFVSGLSEALRRTINRVAAGERARRVRERIALEILPVARKRAEVLEKSGLQAQLDRIAGTRVM